MWTGKSRSRVAFGGEPNIANFIYPFEKQRLELEVQKAVTG